MRLGVTPLIGTGCCASDFARRADSDESLRQNKVADRGSSPSHLTLLKQTRTGNRFVTGKLLKDRFECLTLYKRCHLCPGGPGIMRSRLQSDSFFNSYDLPSTFEFVIISRMSLSWINSFARPQQASLNLRFSGAFAPNANSCKHYVLRSFLRLGAPCSPVLLLANVSLTPVVSRSSHTQEP